MISGDHPRSSRPLTSASLRSRLATRGSSPASAAASRANGAPASGAIMSKSLLPSPMLRSAVTPSDGALLSVYCASARAAARLR
eukprot:scaffold44040_cov69-Phaeocystis_antarctica.AAC.2